MGQTHFTSNDLVEITNPENPLEIKEYGGYPYITLTKDNFLKVKEDSVLQKDRVTSAAVIRVRRNSSNNVTMMGVSDNSSFSVIANDGYDTYKGMGGSPIKESIEYHQSLMPDDEWVLVSLYDVHARDEENPSIKTRRYRTADHLSYSIVAAENYSLDTPAVREISQLYFGGAMYDNISDGDYEIDVMDMVIQNDYMGAVSDMPIYAEYAINRYSEILFN